MHGRQMIDNRCRRQQAYRARLLRMLLKLKLLVLRQRCRPVCQL